MEKLGCVLFESTKSYHLQEEALVFKEVHAFYDISPDESKLLKNKNLYESKQIINHKATLQNVKNDLDNLDTCAIWTRGQIGHMDNLDTKKNSLKMDR